jgi:Fur family ferric uptake transcriptional regulator
MRRGQAAHRPARGGAGKRCSRPGRPATAGSGRRCAASVDRVTVYRVLDWLVSLGLAHRIAGEDRTWRFLATHGEAHATHAHFMCSRCGRTVCLDEVAVPPAVKVPRGFEPSHVELNVKGVCAACR